MAFSSMVFIELNMKFEHRSRANRKILVSWLTSSSKAPMPSLSTTSIFIFSPLYSLSMVSLHIQRPLVQGLMVGPTPKPEDFLLRMTRFKRKDLPVRYFPATAITPTFSLMPPKNCLASSLTTYFSIVKVDKVNLIDFTYWLQDRNISNSELLLVPRHLVAARRCQWLFCGSLQNLGWR